MILQDLTLNCDPELLLFELLLFLTYLLPRYLGGRMNYKSRIVSIALIVALSGCATSGQAVKDKNLLNVFVSQAQPSQAANVISEMSKYCSRNLLEQDVKEFKIINKFVIDYKVKNSSHYFMRIEVDATGLNQSKVSIFHIMDTEVTRNMARQVEKWVSGNSKECVLGF